MKPGAEVRREGRGGNPERKGAGTEEKMFQVYLFI